MLIVKLYILIEDALLFAIIDLTSKDIIFRLLTGEEMGRIFIAFCLVICLLIISSISTAEDKYIAREKEYLLNLARQTLYWYLKDGSIPQVNEAELSENLKEKKACFVTLEKNGVGLRGCMGMFEPVKTPLYRNVIDRAIASATKDTRFPRLNYNELKDIKIEISILTTPKELKFTSAADLLSKLRPFQDGVILETRYGSSTYLPQVWEQLPGKEDFLSHLCRKHRAPADYWKKNYRKSRVQTYEAIVFGEEAYGRRVIGKKGAVVGKKGAFVIGAVKLLPENIYLGGYKVKEGTELSPGAIMTEDSDIIEK